MELSLWLKAVLLGILEGLTEFLPISSTGHLILVGEILKFNEIPGKVFEIVIQLGAVLAVCIVYRQRLYRVATGMWTKAPEQRFVGNILLAFLPAMVLGAVFHDVIKAVLFRPDVVAVMLILGGIAILAIERRAPRVHKESVEDFSPLMAVKIGLCQCLALIPGVSRSGATILGARLLGASPVAAAEFSFFLAVPTMLAATVYDIAKNLEILKTANHLEILILGFITAFITALVVVRGCLQFITRYGFAPFGWYRIALGALVLWTMR